MLPFSWAPASFCEVTEENLYVISTKVTDWATAMLVAEGQLEFRYKEIVENIQDYQLVLEMQSDRLPGKHIYYILHFLEEANISLSDGFTLYLHGVMSTTNDNEIRLIVSLIHPPSEDISYIENIRALALQVIANHENEIKHYHLEMERRTELVTENKLLESFRYIFPPTWKGSLSTMLHTLPSSLMCSDASQLEALVPKYVNASSVNVSPPRDTNYKVLRCKDADNDSCFKQTPPDTTVVYWYPCGNKPSYSEVRWSLIKTQPNFLAHPRSGNLDNPVFENPSLHPISSVRVTGPHVRLEGVTVKDESINSRIDDTKAEIKANGLDAIAWYKPFHYFTENIWGIYFDARKLDALAFSIFMDISGRGVPSAMDVSANLAFGMVYAHEFFHARVEAALTWMELNAGAAKLKDYKDNVYKKLAGTNEWLEEALANFSAFEWCGKYSRELELSDIFSQQKLMEVVEHYLDMSPLGYSNWRVGTQAISWKRLANQMMCGKDEIYSECPLPLQSILDYNELPYDLMPSDVPIYFVGEGGIAEAVKTSDWGFNLPVRRELISALKYFGYTEKPERGKGSHIIWYKEGRGFPLPSRDPVSYQVFQSFLHFIGITKREYMNDIRPHL